jgi:hypothetical protein
MTKPCMMLLKNPYNLFFAEPPYRHCLSRQLENRLTLNAGPFRGAGHYILKKWRMVPCPPLITNSWSMSLTSTGYK